MIYYFVAAPEAYAMQTFLSSWGIALAGRIEIVTYEAFLSGQQHVPEREASYIFNTFNALNRMGPKAVSTICDLHDRLVDACGPKKVLNDPRKALNRYEFLRTLHERGINRFNVYRLTETPTRFPVFVRKEAGTEYNEPRLHRDAADYDMTVNWTKWMWKSVDGLIAIEFCDTADANGVYRKYGAFVVGDRIIPRHVFFSRNWLVKLADLAEPAMIEEELAYLDSNPHADLLRECARIAQMSYGRIDYSLLDGHPQIWEININPMLASRIAEAIPARRPANLKFVAMITDAFDALDAGRPRTPDVVIRKMCEADRPQVMDLLARWNMAPRAPTADVPDPERSTIAADGTAFVAVSGDKIAGVASYIIQEPGRAETASLAVDPAWRGTGVGERLQCARLAELKARGVEFVRTECDRSEVVGWYVRKFGYQIVGTAPKKHAFSLEGVDHWTVLELNLRAWQPSN